MVFSSSDAGSSFHPPSPTPTDEGSPSPPLPRHPMFPSSGKRGPPAPTRRRMPAKMMKDLCCFKKNVPHYGPTASFTKTGWGPKWAKVKLGVILSRSP